MNVRVDLLVGFAGAAEIYDTDISATRIAEKDVLRLQIAMDHALVLQKLQTRSELSRKTSDQRDREPSKGMCPDQLVEVDTETWRDDAKMRSEVEGRGDSQGRVSAIRVLRSIISNDSNVDARLQSLTHSFSLLRMLTSTRAC